MKIVRFEAKGQTGYGIIEGQTVKTISGLPWDGINLTGNELPLASVKLLAPVHPPDVFAIGLNYKAHADESGFKYPAAPVIFLKATSSVIGPGESIILPNMAPDEVDYEAELAIVIGKTCKNVREEDALSYVLGYTCGNDVSARDCQLKQDTQWARGKSFDTFCPLGPWIETDMDPDNAAISLKLNGETMQSSNTNDMIFSCSQLVSYCSRVATLKPGTVIMTGTPSGVGFSRKPPVFMKPGDTVEVIIDGIGTLSNPVSADSLSM
ncbi:MAG TPA: fumarylacetoacetate hydrolase family protein [Armatimonadota bacterium]|nr:fumarylacetoacetate hydrolase family protein [Armatimonadota bacterium]